MTLIEAFVRDEIILNPYEEVWSIRTIPHY